MPRCVLNHCPWCGADIVGEYICGELSITFNCDCAEKYRDDEYVGLVGGTTQHEYGEFGESEAGE